MRILLVVYDNASYIHDFPTGLAYIAAVLQKEGIHVEIYNQDLHHYPEAHLTEFLNKNRYDVVGVSVIGGYYQYRKLLKISDAINSSKKRPLYIIGGHGPAPEPEYFIKKTKADVVVIGEGENTIVNLLNAIVRKTPYSTIKGIAYNDSGKVIVNERQPLIKDIDTIPWPAYELFPMNYYRLLPMPNSTKSDFVMRLLSGRGCPYTCNFCYRMDKGFRKRKTEAIIEEIKYLKKDYAITYISFNDELLMSSVSRVENLCKSFIKENMNIRWCCNGRLNLANPDILKLMKEAGCVFINYGIEAMDDEVLRKMNKSLDTKQIVSGIEATVRSGISPGVNIIFGHIGDNKKTLEKGVAFLLKYNDGTQLRTMRPVTPYPGSPLYYYAIENGLLKDCEDFYENKHVNSDLLAINFTDLSDEEFHQSLFDANRRLIENHFKNKSKCIVNEAKQLYMEKDASFRGFRQI